MLRDSNKCLIINKFTKKTMVFNTRSSQITCIYSSSNTNNKKLMAYLSASKKKVLTIDIDKTMLSDTQWHDIALKLNISLADIMHVNAIKEFNKGTYSEESLVKILANNPEALKGAIILEGQQIAHVTIYSELLKFFNVDSAGLDKTMHTEDPVISSKTKNDSFI